MTPISRFALLEPAPEVRRPVFTTLTFDGAPTGVLTSGDFINAQFAVSPGFLLVLTLVDWECDMLEVLLLDAHLALIDRAKVYGVQLTAPVNAVQVVDDRTLDLDLKGGTPWRLKALDAMTWRLSMPSKPMVFRHRLFRRQIELAPLKGG